MENLNYRSDEEMLEFYLVMPRDQRDKRFADTASAAELVGRSQRTIQLWIEAGAVRAIHIGGKYKVDLHSLVKHLKSFVNEKT
jgi:excisionase family DNA binding protein